MKKRSVFGLTVLLVAVFAGAGRAWLPPVSITGIHVGFNHPLYVDGFGDLGGSDAIQRANMMPVEQNSVHLATFFTILSTILLLIPILLF